MAESEVKIRVRLELDEGDKSTIRNQARAIRETGSSPISSSQEESFRGGIFGDTQDPDVKGFEKRQAVGGGVERLRDRSSKAPIDLKSAFEIAAEDAAENKKALKEQELEFKKERRELGQLLANPKAAVEDRIRDAFTNIPFITPLITAFPVITAILHAPAMVDGLVKLLKDHRIVGVFKRDVLNERNPFLSREQQRARQIGDAHATFSNTSGFTSSNGNLTSNSLSQIRANGISDIGLRDKTGGLF